MRSSPLLLAAAAAAVADGTWQYFNTTNAVNGCGEACVDTPPFRCLGTVKTFADCITACASAGTACGGILTLSTFTGNCWTRTDATWDPEQDAVATAGCDDAVVEACAPPPPPYSGGAINVTVGAPLGTTHPLSPAVTLDFWRHDDPTYGVKWGNSSAQEIDLANPRLRALTAALSPVLLRLGGSPEDSLIYDADGTCVPQSGGSGPGQGDYYCSQVKPYSYDCLSPTRWEALLAFASDTGARIIFGLNGCYGRLTKNTSMDYTNAQALMKAAAASPHASALYGFELSNEVVPNTITPYIWGQDVAALKAMSDGIFSAAGLPLPKFAGCDQGGSSPIAEIAATTTPGTLEAYTYHQYPQCTDPGQGYVLSPTCLNSLDALAVAAKAASETGPSAPSYPAVWAGETADHSGGGILNLTDTFRSSFYYTWQLGALPQHGVELAARQCLSGGDYELLSRLDFSPNPDYFIIWLYKALIGGPATAFSVNTTVPVTDSGVRVFAFSATPASKGGLTLVAMNLQAPGGASTPITLNLLGPSVSGRPRVEYHLTGDVGAEHGPVACNGVALGVGAGDAPPPWQSLGVPASGPLLLAPASIVFATVM